MSPIYRFCIPVFFVFMFSQTLHSQWNSKTTMGEYALDVRGMGDPEDIDTIKQRKMIVMVLQDDVKVVSKLTKSGDTAGLAAYKLSVKTINDNFIEAVNLLWPYHEEFIYKSYDELQAMEKELKPQYAVIYFARYETYTDEGETKVRTSYDINWGGDYLVGGKGYAAKNRSDKDFYTVMKVSLLEELRKAPPFQVPMSRVVPNKADMYFGLNYARWYMHMKLERVSEEQMNDTLQNNCRKLENLVLLISADDVRHGLIDDPFKAYYPIKFNVVPKEMLEEIIMTNASGYAYLLVNCGKACVMNTQTGEPLYISRLYDWDTYISFDKMGKEIAKIIGK